MNDLLDPATDQSFIKDRARALADQMDIFNSPDGHPSNVELQTWAGMAAGILRMVADA